MIYDAVDLFAGGGGWDVAAAALGLRVLGIENDHSACRTRLAAGLPTVEADVRACRRPAGAEGLIASPPCQTFSIAGRGAGRAALDWVLFCADRIARGEEVDFGLFADERTGLVLQPLIWALAAIKAGQPYRWIALEQVPSALPVWQRIAEALAEHGYRVSTGCLNAEQYGVPQTRRRAILIASLDQPARLPQPSHSRYYVKEPDRLDPGVLPWVSMAEALGWPDGVVGFPRLADRASNKAGADRVQIGEQVYRSRDLRPVDRPAQVVTEKARSWQRWLVTGARTGATVRPMAEPAPTITGAKDMRERRWELAGPGQHPAVTSAQHRRGFDGPAPTVNGDPRLAPRGCKHPGPGCCSAYPGRPGRQFGEGSVRVSVAEAAALQTFSPDHPWRGSQTSQHRQVGNAIPPLLALPILSAATGREARADWPADADEESA